LYTDQKLLCYDIVVADIKLYSREKVYPVPDIFHGNDRIHMCVHARVLQDVVHHARSLASYSEPNTVGGVWRGMKAFSVVHFDSGYNGLLCTNKER
jgi:hypothetical protein